MNCLKFNLVAVAILIINVVTAMKFQVIFFTVISTLFIFKLCGRLTLRIYILKFTYESFVLEW